MSSTKFSSIQDRHLFVLDQVDGCLAYLSKTLLVPKIWIAEIFKGSESYSHARSLLQEKTLAHWIAMNVITERRLMATPPEVSESSDELEFAGRRWRWQMTVTQTAVEGLRRMDVSVRQADKPEGTALATVTGFYGTAIGAIGGTTLPWANGQPSGTAGQDGQDGDGDGGKNSEPVDRTPDRPGKRPQRPDPGDEE